MKNRGLQTPPAKKILKAQLVGIKKSLILPRQNPQDTGDFDSQEHGKLFTYMYATAKELMGLKNDAPCTPLPELLLVTLKIKTKTFIKENLPKYAARLQK